VLSAKIPGGGGGGGGATKKGPKGKTRTKKEKLKNTRNHNQKRCVLGKLLRGYKSN